MGRAAAVERRAGAPSSKPCVGGCPGLTVQGKQPASKPHSHPGPSAALCDGPSSACFLDSAQASRAGRGEPGSQAPPGEQSQSEAGQREPPWFKPRTPCQAGKVNTSPALHVHQSPGVRGAHSGTQRVTAVDIPFPFDRVTRRGQCLIQSYTGCESSSTTQRSTVMSHSWDLHVPWGRSLCGQGRLGLDFTPPTVNIWGWGLAGGPQGVAAHHCGRLGGRAGAVGGTGD